MRADSLGLFWQDIEKVKVLKEVIKRTPPERTWERPDYLPGLEEAQRFDVPLFTDAELIAAAQAGERMVFDIECYPNYFLIAFRSIASGKVIYFEKVDEGEIDLAKMSWVLHSFCQIGFNSISYDAPIAALALAGKSNSILQSATNEIIQEEVRSSDLLRKYKTKKLQFDHIDIIEVAPLRASLKIYGGRLHVKKMQDLPFPPGTVLSPEQIAIVRWYCINDLDATEKLYKHLEKEIQLRETLGKEYSLDLRSKSDAQIAESVIYQEVTKYNGRRPQRPEIAIGTSYRYRVPPFLQFRTPEMQWTLEAVRNADFVVGEFGAVVLPAVLSDLVVPIRAGRYRLGIGGLHSSEKCQSVTADAEYLLLDRDVTSYYPMIILNLGLYPAQLGPNFLSIYRGTVNRRLEAKRTGNKVVADSLKITINGSFGKFGSKYSVLYSPDLLIQTTITGQLSLLMLIERLELAGVHVMSANTDGILVRCPRMCEAKVEEIFAQWERDTRFETEEVRYSAVYSRDVNNYIAVKEKGGFKAKGAYSEASLHKNPTNYICVRAIQELLVNGTLVEQTVRNCKDIREFVSVRVVKGGAVKDGKYLGKSIRWYYATNEAGEIVYALSGNKVPRSNGAKPLMVLPEVFPGDVNYDWYIAEANLMLKEIGFIKTSSLEHKQDDVEDAEFNS